MTTAEAFDYERYQSCLDVVRGYGPTALFMDRVIRKVAARFRGLHILDLGCGTGHISLMMERHNRIVSFDPALEGVRITRARRRQAGGFVVGSGETLPFQDESFDAVLLIDVLEHIADDAAVAREACRVLRPGGWVLCTVPENARLYSRLDAAHGHVRRYSADQLGRLFGQCSADVLFDYGFPFMRLYLGLLARAHDTVVPTEAPRGIARVAMAVFAQALSALFSLDLLFAGSFRGVELVALFRKPGSGRATGGVRHSPQRVSRLSSSRAFQER